jgi:hypothetical protein
VSGKELGIITKMDFGRYFSRKRNAASVLPIIERQRIPD